MEQVPPIRWAVSCLIPLLLCIWMPPEIKAETRRALLVGINTYETAGAKPTSGDSQTSGRRTWKNLRGSVNDVRAMREILMHRFGLPEKNILVLENEAATRQAILNGFRAHLIDPARPGDLSIFYYAGHGSRIWNSNSTELDKKDETIVPADVNQPNLEIPIVDIRDKEWDRLFTQALDKGVQLTAIFDSCHSGSISRGPVPLVAQARFVEEDRRDVAILIGPEPPAHPPGQEPEKRAGALIISAAQEDQQAKEGVLQVGNAQEWHGLFTLALTGALNDLPSNASVERVFDQVTARLKANGLQQEPMVAGSEARRRAPLFGGQVASDAGNLRLNVIRAYAKDDVEFQGGVALGLTPETELKKVHPGSDGAPVRAQVVEVRDIARSRAKILQGNWQSLRPGDEFEVIRRGAPPEDSLRLWAPPVFADEQEAVRLADELARLSRSRGMTWVEDPTQTPPTHLLYWNGTQWLLNDPTGKQTGLGRASTAKQIVDRLENNPRATHVFVNIPPSAALLDALDLGHVSALGAIRVATMPDEAHYVLVGRLVDRTVEYAWILKDSPVETNPAASMAVSPLPVRTAWGRSSTAKARCEENGLRDCLARVAKIHHWLTVKRAGDDERFPYTLALRRVNDTALIKHGNLAEGAYRLVLDSDPGRIEEVQKGWGLQSRYVYVFVIDREGKSSLLFPNDASKEKEHLLPREDQLHRPPREIVEIPLGDSGVIHVHPPFGADTYVLLTSAHPIPRIKDLVESEKVVEAAERMRGNVDWSIQRLFLRSVAAPAR